MLNLNSLLPKIEEICHLAGLKNASVISISKTKFDLSILNSEIVIEGYDFVRLDPSRTGGDVVNSKYVI